MDITGTNNGETLPGTGGADVISGLGGDDLLLGFNGDDALFGGDGDDILRGNAGNNFFSGGLGDDTYQLTGTFEDIEIGLGDDLVDLSSFSAGDGFVTLFPHFGAMGVFAIIDGEEDFGVIRIDNGFDEEGLVFFQDLNNALQLDNSKPEGGMQVIGTDFDDTFLIDPGAQGWIQIRPGEGEDEIRIEGTTGTVRLDYSDQNDSIFANLKFGIIVDGGQGFDVDRITGSGAVTQLRGTDFDDTIYGGNADETFILRQGDDFVSGGQGIDTVRYDRSGVEAVTVDLGFGTATGIWNGEAFSDTLRNIENVRGSRTENDTLRGSTKDNVIDGRGGNDLIQGKAGNDILFGGDGFDRFLFKDNDGDDYIGDFNALSNREKINLKQVTEITNFADLMANHVSEASGPDFQQTYISDGVGLNITLDGVALADLNAGDFIF